MKKRGRKKEGRKERQMEIDVKWDKRHFLDQVLISILHGAQAPIDLEGKILSDIYNPGLLFSVPFLD